MAKMTKGVFTVLKRDNKESVNGYLFDLTLPNNIVKKMGVYENKADKRWDVIDTMTGLSLCHAFTRKDAVALAESEPMVKRFTEYLASEEYAKVPTVEAPKPEKLVPPAPKPPKEDWEERVAELEKKLAAAEARAKSWEEMAEKYHAASPEPPAEQASTVSLDAMQKWCSEHGNMVATQKREGCCIWVEGDTKPHQKELAEMGFRWGRSRKGWYYDPNRA